MVSKVSRIIVPLLKFQHILPSQAFIPMYNDFICRYLDCRGVLYDKVLNASFHQETIRHLIYCLPSYS